MNFFNKLFGAGESDNKREFQTLIEQSMEELRLKTEAHNSAWRLGESSWDIDQDAGTVVFTRPDGIIARCSVQIIGTYNTIDSSWLWGWNHPSVVPALQLHAHKIRTYGEKHGIEYLTTQKIVCTENQAWEFTALACKLCEAEGAYRGSTGSTLVFITFNHVTLSQLESEPSLTQSIAARVNSREAAIAAHLAGELEKVYLFPIEFGGIDDEVNIVYVSSLAAAEKKAFDVEVGRLLEQGKVGNYEACPEYDDQSFIPSRIVVKASGSQLIQKTIEVTRIN
ncbi:MULTISPECIES: DUF6882 domain-containing protein [Nostoc cyanobionts]|uniref:DUF6882 domain-containing protein n=1 Tax=Nostoc cyanobionts TaxID=3123326 RepID=UPI000D0C57EA|nr:MULTISPECIES: DUF6882 domain-containing protein [unclassified Nostoc]AVH64074.1 hypothetical protein NPM_2379 [Nostoc sp. 'Peltigera membranacea cyanobiont' N6]